MRLISSRRPGDLVEVAPVTTAAAAVAAWLSSSQRASVAKSPYPMKAVKTPSSGTSPRSSLLTDACFSRCCRTRWPARFFVRPDMGSPLRCGSDRAALDSLTSVNGTGVFRSVGL